MQGILPRRHVAMASQVADACCLRCAAPAGRVAVAMFSSCPDVCHKNTSMLQATLSSTFKSLAIPHATRIYMSFLPSALPHCQEYRHMVRRLLADYNHCFFYSNR